MQITSILLSILLLCAPTMAQMQVMRVVRRAAASNTVTLIQSAVGANDTTTVAFSGNTAAGNTIVACATWVKSTTGTGYSLTGLSDTQGNTWTISTASRIAGAGSSVTEIGIECGYTTTASATAADTVTCTISAGPEHYYCDAWEIHGSGSRPAIDQVSTGSGTGTAISAGSVTTTQNGDIGISAAITNNGRGQAGNFTAGSGWTLVRNTGAGNWDMGSEYVQQSTAGSLTGDFTEAFSGNWYATMLTFK